MDRCVWFRKNLDCTNCTIFTFCVPGYWTVDDLHPVSSRLHQPFVWQPVSDGCSEISVLSAVSDVPAALPAADWSQTCLHPQPAVLPGSHTDQVIGSVTRWQDSPIALNPYRPAVFMISSRSHSGDHLAAAAGYTVCSHLLHAAVIGCFIHARCLAWDKGSGADNSRQAERKMFDLLMLLGNRGEIAK